jgi:hypothetical protein
MGNIRGGAADKYGCGLWWNSDVFEDGIIESNIAKNREGRAFLPYF